MKIRNNTPLTLYFTHVKVEKLVSSVYIQNAYYKSRPFNWKFYILYIYKDFLNLIKVIFGITRII